MARGWESKSIESQQEDAAKGATKAAPLSAEETARIARRRTLELGLARARADRAAAVSPAHRAMLDTAIAALEGQLSNLR